MIIMVWLLLTAGFYFDSVKLLEFIGRLGLSPDFFFFFFSLLQVEKMGQRRRKIEERGMS